MFNIDAEISGFEKALVNIKRLPAIEASFTPALKFAIDAVVIDRIKAVLGNDTRPKWGDHIFTGNLLASTRSEMSEVKREVTFGYFISHGLNIEPLPGKKRTSPRKVEFAALRAWMKHRYPGLKEETLDKKTTSLRKYIMSYGTKAYPIIIPVYEDNKSLIMEAFAVAVLSRMRTVIIL